MLQNPIFQHFQFHFCPNSLWQQIYFCTKISMSGTISLRHIPSEINYQCLIFRVIDQYDQFENDRRKIHDFSWNVLLNMVLKFACQTRFGSLILHFNVVRIYKCWNVIYTTESKMAARKCSKFHIFLQIFQEHVFYSVRKPPRSVSFGSETPHESKAYD